MQRIYSTFYFFYLRVLTYSLFPNQVDNGEWLHAALISLCGMRSEIVWFQLLIRVSSCFFPMCGTIDSAVESSEMKALPVWNALLWPYLFFSVWTESVQTCEMVSHMCFNTEIFMATLPPIFFMLFEAYTCINNSWGWAAYRNYKYFDGTWSSGRKKMEFWILCWAQKA